MRLTHFSSNVIVIVPHGCRFSGADRRNWLLQCAILIRHTKQLANSYDVHAIQREGCFSCWAFMIIESNHIRAHGESMGKQAASEGAVRQVPTAGVEPQVQLHRPRMVLLSKGLKLSWCVLSSTTPWLTLGHLGWLIRSPFHCPWETHPKEPWS